jgi:hypothetical protein
VSKSVSEEPTKWAVHCVGDRNGDNCGLVFLTEEEYLRQLDVPGKPWCCPQCGGKAWWDNDIYQAAMDKLEKEKEGAG